MDQLFSGKQIQQPLTGDTGQGQVIICPFHHYPIYYASPVTCPYYPGPPGGCVPPAGNPSSQGGGMPPVAFPPPFGWGRPGGIYGGNIGFIIFLVFILIFLGFRGTVILQSLLKKLKQEKSDHVLP